MKLQKLFIFCINQEITKKVCNNIIKSIKVYYKKMNIIFLNSENSKTFKPHILTLYLTHKIDLRRGEKSIVLPSLSIYYTWKNLKKSYNNN